MAEPKQSELSLSSLADVSELLRSKKLSPVELTQACLARIEALNPELNAFITVTAEMALGQARAAEAEIQRGNWRGPLHGIPLAFKDLIDVAGVPTTAASRVFENRVPTEDAEVVRRLKAAGAVIVGKNNLHECAYGGSGVISRYGPAKNPRYKGRTTAGSSSGSAAAVAAGLCFGAIVTDTAGSIRLPAAFCGIVGFKPTYGLVSARGVMPLSWSLDHIGPMARSVTDAALILAAIAGYDPADPTSREIAVEDYAAAVRAPSPKLRVGVPRKFFYEDLDSEVARVVEDALRIVATTRGGNARGLSSGEQRPHGGQGRNLCLSLAVLVRARGQVRSGNAAPHQHRRRRERARLRCQAAGVGAGTAQRGGRSSKMWMWLLRRPRRFRRRCSRSLQADMSRLRERELVMLRNTRPFNVLGLPAISVPCGETSAGLPVALQIAGPAGNDARVLGFARAFEDAR